MKIQNHYEKYVKFSIYLAVIALVNIVGLTLFFRMDLTHNRIYSISEASKEVVTTLSEPLTIKVFFTKNLPAPHNNTEQYLHDLLNEYALFGNRLFNYSFYDVSPEEEGISEKARENQDLAKSYGIYPVQIRAIEEDEIKFKKAYMGLVMIHGDLMEKIPTITATDGLEYQITTAIMKLNNKISALLGLKDPIKVTLLLSSSLEKVAPLMGINNLSDFSKTVENTVKKLSEKNYDKLSFNAGDPSADQNLDAVVKKHKIMTLKWPAIPEKNIQAGEGAIGLLMEHGEKSVVMPLMHVLRLPLIGTRYELVDMEGLDEAVNSAIESLIDINEKIGYLADKGTLQLTGAPAMNPMGMRDKDSLSNFNNLLSQSYTAEEINIKDELIPENLKTLIIAGPQEQFSDYELYQIDQALMKGTNLALFLDTFQEVETPKQQYAYAQGPSYAPLDTGLEKLLEHYGIRLKKSYVMDESCYKQVLPPQMGGGERPIYFAPLIKNEAINHKPEFMQNIKGLITMKISPLEIMEKRIRENGLKATRLFSSSGNSWEMSDNINLNPLFIRPPATNKEKKSIPLAYMLEGNFHSYFEGKPIPEKQTGEAETENEDSKPQETSPASLDTSRISQEGVFRAKGQPAKIFLIATAEMLKDTMLDAEGKTPNATFLMNVIDNLNKRDEIAVMRSKEQRFNPLEESTAFAKSFVKFFNIAGLPALVVIFGLFVWLKRNSRKKHIQAIFQK